MKKLFLTLVLSISLFANAQSEKVLDKTSKSIETVYSDSKDGVKTIYNDLKSTTPQIKNALQILSKELKTTTDSLWLILVKQQLVWSWCFLILLFSSFLNWFLFYRRNLSKNLKYEKVNVIISKYKYADGTTQKDIDNYPNSYGKKWFDCQEEDIRLVPNTTISYFKYIHLAACITLSCFSFYHFSDMMTGFINPEFGALKTITEVVKNIK